MAALPGALPLALGCGAGRTAPADLYPGSSAVVSQLPSLHRRRSSALIPTSRQSREVTAIAWKTAGAQWRKEAVAPIALRTNFFAGRSHFGVPTARTKHGMRATAVTLTLTRMRGRTCRGHSAEFAPADARTQIRDDS